MRSAADGGVVVSAWIVTVLGVAYWLQRPVSLARACIQVIGLKWVFWVSALWTLATDGG